MEAFMDMLGKIASRMMLDSRRHEVLAGNIANAQTPGYKAKDVISSEFGQVMAMAVTSSGHQSGGGAAGAAGAAVRQGPDEMATLDGNNVDLDQERALVAQNALDFEAQIRFANHYLRQQQAAAG
jgi:flagellar basal-body rod protein FlgB